MSNSRIIFIYSNLSTFVKTDINILSKKYDLIKYQSLFSKNIFSFLISQLRLFFFLVLNISRCKAVYVWFADYHSFLPIFFSKVFNKKSFLVLGGYDVTYLPEINYGSFSNPLRSFCARYSIKNATVNLAVSDNLIEDAKKYVYNANVIVIYTGYSKDKFKMDDDKNNDSVLSVLGAKDLQRAYLKGVDLIIEIAKILSDITFTLIDVNEEVIRNNFSVTNNVKFVKAVPQDELIGFYQKSSVYIQLSLREGLPNSVCEAMLCGCVPVGINAGGIPVAIGDAGYLAENRDYKKIAELIVAALNSDVSLRRKARQRIIEKFSLELREERLFNIINEHISQR